ncbi:hypothetical protein AB0K34_31900 [Actinomadura sp. NPDC049382]|uniref:hypothetical protein n=1 Tax=Actinomadura sp. NPDC049382 TaxID=3158220 RepID=UPI0034448CDE
MIETVYRTEDHPSADRFDRWREWTGRTHCPADLSGEHAADFHGHTRTLLLGERVRRRLRPAARSRGR